eukprot:5173539-Amphidinium_carterae.1
MEIQQLVRFLWEYLNTFDSLPKVSHFNIMENLVSCHDSFWKAGQPHSGQCVGDWESFRSHALGLMR